MSKITFRKNMRTAAIVVSLVCALLGLIFVLAGTDNMKVFAVGMGLVGVSIILNLCTPLLKTNPQSDNKTLE